MISFILARLRLVRYVSALALSFLIVGTQSASAQSLGYFETIFDELGTVLDTAVPVLVALALALFIWGMVRFIFSSGNEGDRAEGKKHMIWGIIALFVVVSVWGLVRVLQTMFGADSDIGSISAPGLPK